MNNELSLEVKAQETHEKAVGFYKISEQYGYKFLMEIKAIRDEKLYKELGFENFEDYTLNNFDFSKRTINERIQTAETFGENFERTRAQLGHSKMRNLANMPEDKRNYVMDNGIETENGNKSIEEVTTRELEEYKKQLKQQQEQNKQFEEMLRKSDDEKSQLEMDLQCEREKEVEYKEVLPENVKRKLEKLENDSKLLEQREQENKKMRKQIHEQKQKIIENQNNNSDNFTDDERISSKRLMAETNLLEIKEYTDEFLNNVSINAFRDAAIANSSDRTKNMIYECSEDVIKWARTMQSKLDSNSIIDID